MPTVLFLVMTVVLPPKSVPSSATPSQLMVRKPVATGGGLAPLLAPPTAFSKLDRAVNAPPDVFVPPVPENVCGDPVATLVPGDNGASLIVTVLPGNATSTLLSVS